MNRSASNSELDVRVTGQGVQAILSIDNEKLADSAVGKVTHDNIVQIAIRISSKVDFLVTAIIELLQSQSDKVGSLGNTVFIAKTQATGSIDFHLVGVEVEVTTTVIAEDGVVVVAEELV